jgi:DNA adenine methylase
LRPFLRLHYKSTALSTAGKDDHILHPVLGSENPARNAGFGRLLFFQPPVRLISRFGLWASTEVFSPGRLFVETTGMAGLVSYIGGKNRLATPIIAIFPEHTTYVEPFAGGAQVFFRKTPSRVEVLNDLDGELVNLYRCAQQHYQELIRYFRYTLVSREWFDLLKRSEPETLTDIQRAARYLYILRNSFASLVANPVYHRNVIQPPGFNLENLPELLENAHQRLQRVQIESKPYEEIVRRFDRPTTLFYCDPPYWGRKLYRHNFGEADFEKLAVVLRKIRGKFILSLNDVPEVRKLFGNFHIQEVELHYTSQKQAGRRYKEVLITNFKPKAS